MPGPGPISNEIPCIHSSFLAEPTQVQSSSTILLQDLWFQFLDLKERETSYPQDRLPFLQREKEAVAFAIAAVNMTHHPELTPEECDWYLENAEHNPYYALTLEEHIADDDYTAFLRKKEDEYDLAPMIELMKRKGLFISH